MIRQFDEEIMDTEIGYRLEEVLEILFEYEEDKKEYKKFDSEIRTTFEVMNTYNNDQIHINIKTYNKKGVLVMCENLFRYYDYYKTSEDFKTLIAILDYITKYKSEEEDDTSFKALKPDMEFENLYGRIDYIISELDSTLEIESF